MDCQDTQTQLQEYLDGQLPAAQAAAIQAHLATCEDCARELALLRQVDEALATYPVLEAPQGLAARTMAQVKREPAAVRDERNNSYPCRPGARGFRAGCRRSTGRS